MLSQLTRRQYNYFSVRSQVQKAEAVEKGAGKTGRIKKKKVQFY